ncbi:MAG: ketoacyl-ACP synthase III [Phycisphaerae bacterium]|nr:ketoacyl-ACP synthase III [Phycisphaerae bacterium]
MKLGWPVEIAGTGAYLPERVVTNDEMAQYVDTSHDWIVQRTGIHERRRAGPGESTVTMAKHASEAALADAGVTPDEIDLIVVATITPDYQLPATACLLQAELGCRWVPAYDMAAACSGYVWALIQAAQYVVNDLAQNVLVVGAEYLTTITDMQDRGTCILFGDAAGAAVIRRSQVADRRMLAGQWGADGYRSMLINIPGGGAKEPASHRTVDERLHFMHMKGREVYKFAVTQMHSILVDTCAEAGVSVDDLKLVVPHQSNLRIIESACKRAGVPMEKVVVNINRYGNSSAASCAVGLHEARQEGRIQEGDLVIMVAFGAGLTWGSLLMRV